MKGGVETLACGKRKERNRLILHAVLEHRHFVFEIGEMGVERKFRSTGMPGHFEGPAKALSVRVA